jgi:hypothetical protein
MHFFGFSRSAPSHTLVQNALAKRADASLDEGQKVEQAKQPLRDSFQRKDDKRVLIKAEKLLAAVALEPAAGRQFFLRQVMVPTLQQSVPTFESAELIAKHYLDTLVTSMVNTAFCQEYFTKSDALAAAADWLPLLGATRTSLEVLLPRPQDIDAVRAWLAESPAETEAALIFARQMDTGDALKKTVAFLTEPETRVPLERVTAVLNEFGSLRLQRRLPTTDSEGNAVKVPLMLAALNFIAPVTMVHLANMPERRKELVYLCCDRLETQDIYPLATFYQTLAGKQYQRAKRLVNIRMTAYFSRDDFQTGLVNLAAAARQASATPPSVVGAGTDTPQAS